MSRPVVVPARHRARPHRRSLALLAATAFVVAACGSPPSSEGSGPGRTGENGGSDLPECPLEALEEAEGPVEVNLWYGGLVPPPSDVLVDMAERFNDSQDQVVVTTNDQGNAYEEVLRQYERTASTPGQLPQIIYLEDTALGQVVDRGQVLPAQACMEADGFDVTDIVPAARAAFEVDGVLYPGYMNVSSPILYYNKSHFQTAGLDPNEAPGTLEELEDVARTLKEAGVSERPLSFKADQWFVSTWVAGAGETVVDNANGRSAPPTQSQLDTEVTQELMAWLDDMNAEGLLNPFPVTEGSIDHYTALLGASPQSSMLIETSTASGTIAQFLGGGLSAEDAGIAVDPELLETMNIVPGSGPMPGLDAPGKIFASGGAFYILNTSSPEQQAASWKFLQFMLEPDNAKAWHIEGGYLPIIKSVVDDPDVREYQETDLAGLLLAPSAAQLATADPDLAGPLIGPYTDYKNAVQGAMERVLFSGDDPATALAQAQRDMDAALDAYNE